MPTLKFDEEPNIVPSYFLLSYVYDEPPKSHNKNSKEELKEWCPILAVELTLREKIKVNLGGAFESQEKGNRQYITTGIGYTAEKVVLNAAYIIPLSDLAGYYQGLFGIGVSYKF